MLLLQKKNPVHDNYKKYHLPYTFEIEDELQNILVTPETCTECFCLSKKIQRVLWWMSVNNYLASISQKVNAALYNPLAIPMIKFFFF